MLAFGGMLHARKPLRTLSAVAQFGMLGSITCLKQQDEGSWRVQKWGLGGSLNGDNTVAT